VQPLDSSGLRVVSRFSERRSVNGAKRLKVVAAGCASADSSQDLIGASTAWRPGGGWSAGICQDGRALPGDPKRQGQQPEGNRQGRSEGALRLHLLVTAAR
jgi:hypothetical protein